MPKSSGRLLITAHFEVNWRSWKELHTWNKDRAEEPPCKGTEEKAEKSSREKISSENVCGKWYKKSDAGFGQTVAYSTGTCM